MGHFSFSFCSPQWLWVFSLFLLPTLVSDSITYPTFFLVRFSLTYPCILKWRMISWLNLGRAAATQSLFQHCIAEGQHVWDTFWNIIYMSRYNSLPLWSLLSSKLKSGLLCYGPFCFPCRKGKGASLPSSFSWTRLRWQTRCSSSVTTYCLSVWGH